MVADIFSQISAILNRRVPISLPKPKHQNSTILDVYSLQDACEFFPEDWNWRRSAVLAPIFFKNEECWLILTKRTQAVEHHRGEISFPGGAKDIEDKTIQDTALRETKEEIGIDSSDVRILGILDDVCTVVSKFIVTPFVGFIPYPCSFQANKLEVDEILEIPLSFFLCEKNWDEQVFYYQNKTIKTFSFHWRKDIIIWGVTAQIIANFCNILTKEKLFL